MRGFFNIFLSNLSCEGFFYRVRDTEHHNHWGKGEDDAENVNHALGPGRCDAPHKFAYNLSQHVASPNDQELTYENEKGENLFVCPHQFLDFMWLKLPWKSIDQGDVVGFKSSIDDDITYNNEWLHY